MLCVLQVWVLTGDKEETAVNISYSAGHFATDMTEIRLTQCHSDDAVGLQLDHLEQMWVDLGTIFTCTSTVIERLHGKFPFFRIEAGSGRRFALVMDGMSLKFALDPIHTPRLRRICLSVVTVLCCRMSPLQKAQVCVAS